ncbi:MAG: flavocytochrome c [Firmicutes bacterium]|nr:flavocytochrome c [Bacillota bacterium]
MRKFKKSLSIVLALVMILSLIGCGATNESPEKTTGEEVEEKSEETSNETSEEDVDATSQASKQTGDYELIKLEETEPTKEKETEQTYDVVIIGAGGAGFTAAISAAENGASVVLLEQEAKVGGNTRWSGAGLDIPENWVQEKKGIEDSKELYKEDMFKGGDGTNIKELVDVLAKNALPTAKWLRDDVGVEFMEDFQKHFGGHSVARAIVVKGGVGSQMIVKELDRAKELGVAVKTHTKAEDLIENEEGKVTGVKAVNSLGQDLTFNANKGVVIASGGFAGNVDMRTEYRPELDENVGTTNTPGHNGDGIVMAEKLGADTTHMKFIQTYPFCFPTSGKISFVADTRMYGAPMINIDGKRFVNENDRRDVVAQSILAQPDGYGYMVWDEAILKEAKTMELYGDEFNQLVEDEVLVKADTLDEAADFFGINKKEMNNTITQYNEYAEDFLNGTDPKKADKTWNRKAKLAKIDEGPFYIQQVIPSVHHTMGGLVIDEVGRVKDTEGNPIAGLYAAGEVVGGIHGNNRLGGNALTDISVFGKIAGESAAKMK